MKHMFSASKNRSTEKGYEKLYRKILYSQRTCSKGVILPCGIPQLDIPDEGRNHIL